MWPAGRGLGAAERGREAGHRGAPVLPELGQQFLVLGVEDNRDSGPGT
jgi:hypothetical protein